MKLAYFVIPLLLPAGLLLWTGRASHIPYLSRVLTVSQFSAKPYLRDRVLMYCADHPDRIDGDPNCANAQQSAASGLPERTGQASIDTTSVAADGMLWRGSPRQAMPNASP